MRRHALNPDGNKLCAGISEEDVVSAVEHSGYPLQMIAADLLRPRYRVQDEWSFVDEQTGDSRTIDLFAEQVLTEPEIRRAELSNKLVLHRVSPVVDLLVECKKSQFPYVFFLVPKRTPWLNYPRICGLPTTTLGIDMVGNGPVRQLNDGTSVELRLSRLDLLSALDLRSHAFVTQPDCCFTFTKCIRGKAKIECSGSEPYQSLTLPLTKAVDYFCNSHRPKKNDTSFWFRAVFGIGLLDAPMIGIELDNGAEKPLLLPWVRVLRHHPVRGQISAIDIVHKDFFQSFLRRHLSPYARQLHNRVIKHADVIAEGRGMIQHLSNSRGLAYDRAIQRQLCPSKMTAQKK